MGAYTFISEGVPLMVHEVLCLIVVLKVNRDTVGIMDGITQA